MSMTRKATRKELDGAPVVFSKGKPPGTDTVTPAALPPTRRLSVEAGRRRTPGALRTTAATIFTT